MVSFFEYLFILSLNYLQYYNTYQHVTTIPTFPKTWWHHDTLIHCWKSRWSKMRTQVASLMKNISPDTWGECALFRCRGTRKSIRSLKTHLYWAVACRIITNKKYISFTWKIRLPCCKDCYQSCYVWRTYLPLKLRLLEGYTIIVFPFGPMYHFGFLSFNSVPENGVYVPCTTLVTLFVLWFCSRNGKDKNKK